MRTRSMYVLDATLAAWTGVGAYLTDPATDATTPLTITPSGGPFQLYEVAVVEGQGSWWLPTAPASLVPQSWYASSFGGVEALQAEGPGIPTQLGAEAVLRPSQALWWIPVATLGENETIVPGENAGSVTGPFPSLEPSPEPAPTPSPTNEVLVEQVAPNHTRITVALGDTPLLIEIRRS